MRNLNLFAKRLMDLLASLLGIIILFPFFFIISLSIKLTSRGPVLFKQERLGKDGRVFKILKFRTMVENAEQIGDGLSVKSEDDSRITKVGKILRKTSLDELPQLWNVIKGDMSLVGPRPAVTYHPYKGYENYPDWAKERFSMRPGITGKAQVTVRNTVSWDERIAVDNQYISSFNIWQDIRILFKTLGKIFDFQDIYMEAGQDHGKGTLLHRLKYKKSGAGDMIRGAKIFLRPIQRNDINFLNKWKNDEETFMFLGGGFMPTSIDQQEKWMDSMMDTSGNNKRFIICEYKGTPLGMVGLYNINWIHRTCEMGIYIGEKHVKGKGYGRTACALMERFAKEYVNLRKIKVDVVSDNQGALKMWEGLGFEKVGELIKERYIKGDYRNLTIMEKFIE